ncbi:MAG TPA: sigma-70 family RNA polymerase sigma factor [Gaiellaceae bacterium]|jgi:RNA polymerase sigma-70 factor (ECF subfamily)|nr:sigma-70 family RNA polymerase sigma factor [Gaiellaceae bacterium]
MTPILAPRLGSDRSFERLYRKYAGDVYRYALVVLRNEADAEDVTQTTFMNAYRAFEQGERPQKPQNWLIAIAHNVCRQRFRQSQRRPNEVAFEEELAEAVVDDDAVSAEDIRRALGHLAFNQRAALVMRELEGRSYQEIAEILEVSVSAVETLIFRARRALREQLEEGITCREAELSISRQLDGRLPRKDRGALRAHLRECEDCAGFARSQRAQRGALKGLAAIPLPTSLTGLFGGGGGAAVGGGIAIKAAAIGATAMLATGVGYEGVKHGIWKAPVSTRAAAVHNAKQAPANPTLNAASVIAPAQEARHDQKPYRAASVKARRDHREHPGRIAVERPERVATPHEESVLPPSRDHGQSAAKPVTPVRAHKPVTPKRPVKTHKPKKTHLPRPDTNKDQGNGSGHGGKPDKPVSPPPPPDEGTPAVSPGKSGR